MSDQLPYGIKIFADGADLEGIVRLSEDPIISGFTTNPTLMRKSGVEDYPGFARKVLDSVTEKPISFEVFSDEFDEMGTQARLIGSWGRNVFVKIPVTNTRGESSAALIRELSAEGLHLNVTAILTLDQVRTVAEALVNSPGAVVSVFAGRIAYRITLGGETDPREGSRSRHRAALAAAIFAGVAVLGLEDYMHYILSAQTDPMIVTFCLAAVDAHLSGRPRWAFWLGVIAALGRPEAWPFLALYSLFVWRRMPSMRWMIFAGGAVILFTWFGIPTITNHRPFVAGQLALKSPRELHQNKITGTIDRFTGLQYLPI